MRSLLFLCFLCLSLTANAQWSSTVTLNSFNNNSFYIDHFCVASENSVFAGGKKKETWTSPSVGIIYYTLDGGMVWDSIEFSNRFISAIKSPSSNVIYFVSTQLVYPTFGSTYQKKYLHRSMNGGQTWTESLIDSTSLGLMNNALSFFNDSVGILKLGSLNFFITRDYGQNWTPINLPVHKFSTTLGGDTLLLEVQNISTVNLTSLDLVNSLYTANCVGTLQAYSKSNETLMRAFLAYDGTALGYPYDNYTSITMDDYPLGHQRILHFPNINIIVSVRLTATNIYLLSGSIASSSDGGYTFYEQYSTEPDADTSVFMYFDFANENIGYAVTRSLADNTYKIQKTTNGGGVTNNFISPPIQFVAGVNEHSKNEISIYPNPTAEKIKITSTNVINRIELIDLYGRTILMSPEVKEYEYSLDLSAYSNGNYIVKIFSNDQLHYLSLIKE
jgi:hypothetical protein